MTLRADLYPCFAFFLVAPDRLFLKIGGSERRCSNVEQMKRKYINPAILVCEH